jgi:hypothetical protein
VPKFDFTSAEGCLKALESPNLEARYLAFSKLTAMGAKAEGAIESYLKTVKEPRQKARAIWLFAKLPGEADEAVELATADKDPDIRVLGVRLARESGLDVAKLAPLAKDQAPEVRRELALSLRHSKSPAAARLWADLAMLHDGYDRWYLEALGIGADKQWDKFLEAYLAQASEPWKTPAGRDILWRSRAKQTPALLVKIIKDPATKEDDQPRYFRSLDFLSGPEKEAALKTLLE